MPSTFACTTNSIREIERGLLLYYLVYADQHGRAYEDTGYRAVFRTGDRLLLPDDAEMMLMPSGASLVVLPKRSPIAIDKNGQMQSYRRQGAQAMAALLPQGYLRTLLPGYSRRAERLPLFGYTGVAWREGRFYVAARAVASPEDLARWDPAHFNTPELEGLIAKRRQELGPNRIIDQLAHCSMVYGCFTAQNIFYRQREGALPISPSCNASCVGCISLQPSECCPAPQNRLTFIPSLDEAAELAALHLSQGGEAISFGQGCEGEPLLQAELATGIIRRVRGVTPKGRLNANTNAGFLRGVQQVVEAGIDSLRISLNSARSACYTPYYRPGGYGLADVVESIRYARRHRVYVSLNLLAMPGITDRQEEVAAMKELIAATGVNQVQFRNLNLDPDLYLEVLPPAEGELLGMLQLVDAVASTGVSLR
ncbi:MAG: hypothetical protein DDT35_01397 [Firmicutes bacterium]|nr:hypothetical protein [Bacillota bacterium]